MRSNNRKQKPSVEPTRKRRAVRRSTSVIMTTFDGIRILEPVPGPRSTTDAQIEQAIRGLTLVPTAAASRNRDAVAMPGGPTLDPAE